MTVNAPAGARTARPDTGRGSDPSGFGDLAANQLGLNDLLGDSLADAFNSAMQMMEWSEDEIEALSRSYPDQADRIWHSFTLLKPIHDRMKTEFVYRSHCRELLRRVIAGEDTRPGTAAECCLACSDTSQFGPFNTSGMGVYIRMWSKAGFPDLDFPREHHEAIAGEAIDEHEQVLRRKLKRDWRQLPKVIKHSPRCPASQAKAKALAERQVTPGD